MDICHICLDVIDYCQGHGQETCDCVCEYGCLCGECDVERAISSVPYPQEEEYENDDDYDDAVADWHDDVLVAYYAIVDTGIDDETYLALLQ